MGQIDYQIIFALFRRFGRLLTFNEIQPYLIHMQSSFP